MTSNEIQSGAFLVKRKIIILTGFILLFFLCYGCSNKNQEQSRVTKSTKSIIGTWFNIADTSDKMEFLPDNSGVSNSIGFKWSVLDDKRIKVEMNSGNTILLGEFVKEDGIEVIKFNINKHDVYYCNDLKAFEDYKMRGYNAAASSDARNLRTQLAGYFADHNQYPNNINEIYQNGYKPSDNVTFDVNALSAKHYNISIYHSKGNKVVTVDSEKTDVVIKPKQ
jgi:hypothetical protein